MLAVAVVAGVIWIESSLYHWLPEDSLWTDRLATWGSPNTSRVGSRLDDVSLVRGEVASIARAALWYKSRHSLGIRPIRWASRLGWAKPRQAPCQSAPGNRLHARSGGGGATELGFRFRNLDLGLSQRRGAKPGRLGSFGAAPSVFWRRDRSRSALRHEFARSAGTRRSSSPFGGKESPSPPYLQAEIRKARDIRIDGKTRTVGIPASGRHEGNIPAQWSGGATQPMGLRSSRGCASPPHPAVCRRGASSHSSELRRNGKRTSSSTASRKYRKLSGISLKLPEPRTDTKRVNRTTVAVIPVSSIGFGVLLARLPTCFIARRARRNRQDEGIAARRWPSRCATGGHDVALQHLERLLRPLVNVPAGEGGDQA